MWLVEDHPFSFLSGISLLWNLPAFAGLLPTTGDDRATDFAVAALLLSMATVVIWLTVQIGKGLQQRKLFLFMGILYGICGAARIVSELGYSSAWPAWLVAPMHIFVPAALVVLSIFMFSFIPPLIKVLRASDEVRSLRGQAKLQALVQAAPMAVVGTDLQGRVTSWNPAAERIFGYKAEEILGTLAVTHPEDKKTEHHDLLELTFKGTVTKGFESERTDRTGRRFPVSISTAPLHDEAGQLMGLMATIEDITERKSIERELSEKTVTLAAVTDALNCFLESGDWAAASKRLLSHALEQTQSPCGFLGVVLDGPNLRVLAHEGGTWDESENRKLYEAKMSQQAARGYFELSHHDNLLGEIIRKERIVVANELPEGGQPGGTPAGHPKIHSFLGVPILKGSTVVGVIAVANRTGGYTGEESRSLKTISQATGVLYDNYRQNLKQAQAEEQRKRLEGEFRQAQKMEVLGQLSGGIAHDFNNMLMVLSGSAELLEKSLPPLSPSSRYVEQIRRTVEKAAAITKQLLASSRKQVLEITPIDLHEVLTDCEFMLPRLLGADVQLTFQHQAVHSWIRADAAQLEQVIANLAINARDAMPEGGSLRISTRNSPTLPELTSDSEDSRGFAGWLVLEVKDSGFGMDEETRAHIFEPFFTTKPEGKGTGLGLPTVYGIIRQFGAHIFVESQPGEGTQFQIYFPVRNPVVQLQREAPVASLRQGEALTILLADDEPSLRAAIAEYLRGAGQRVLDSQSAHDALELARSHSGPIDVLLTDVVMPGLRGTELAHQVEQFHPGIHVMFISGYAQSLPEAQLPRSAVFLQKPFRLASLGEQLKLVPRKV